MDPSQNEFNDELLDELLQQAVWPEASESQVSRLQQEWHDLSHSVMKSPDRFVRRSPVYTVVAAVAMVLLVVGLTLSVVRNENSVIVEKNSAKQNRVEQNRVDRGAIEKNGIESIVSVPIRLEHDPESQTFQGILISQESDVANHGTSFKASTDPRFENAYSVDLSTIVNEQKSAAADRIVTRRVSGEEQQGYLAFVKRGEQAQRPTANSRTTLLANSRSADEQLFDDVQKTVNKYVNAWSDMQASWESQLAYFAARQPEGAVQAAAVRLLSSFGSEHASQLLEQLNELPQTHANAVRVMMGRVSARRLRALIEAEADPFLRRSLIEQLIARGTDNSVREYLVLLSTPNYCEQALSVLHSCENAPEELLLSYLKNSRQEKGLEAALALGACGSDATVVRLIQMIKLGQSRRQALFALSVSPMPRAGDFLTVAKRNPVIWTELHILNWQLLTYKEVCQCVSTGCERLPVSHGNTL